MDTTGLPHTILWLQMIMGIKFDEIAFKSHFKNNGFQLVKTTAVKKMYRYIASIWIINLDRY